MVQNLHRTGIPADDRALINITVFIVHATDGIQCFIQVHLFLFTSIVYITQSRFSGYERSTWNYKFVGKNVFIKKSVTSLGRVFLHIPTWMEKYKMIVMPK